MWVQDCGKKCISIDSNMIWGKVKSFHDDLKKRMKDLKPENWILVKDDLIILERVLALKMSG